jgi:hypothetical protein
MTEEIKEILNKLLEYFKESNINDFGYEKDKLISYEEAQILLNYITNLQKENEKLKEELNCKEHFSSTMPENTEFVILTKENYDKQQKDLALENIILKSRNEKFSDFIYYNLKFVDDSDLKQGCDIKSEILEPLRDILEENKDSNNAYLEEFKDYMSLKQELNQYKNNWEELKKWLNKYFVGTMSDTILNKMKELEDDK